jgi:hypothetical protein
MKNSFRSGAGQEVATIEVRHSAHKFLASDSILTKAAVFRLDLSQWPNP